MFKYCLAILFALFTANSAFAALIINDYTVNRAETDIDTNISFALFDTLNGTRVLNSVTLGLSARSSGTIIVTNRSTTTRNITATLTSDIELLDSQGIVLLQANPLVQRVDSLFSGERVEFVNLRSNDFASIEFVMSASLARFIGTGTDILRFLAVANSSVTGGGGLTTDIDTFASADLRITYDYSLINAPVGLSIFALVLLVISMRRRA